MGWDVNVHVKLQKQLMLLLLMMIFILMMMMFILMMMMMMMMMMVMMMMIVMTLMKLGNSATKFRHGIDKFYEPNSGVRGSKTTHTLHYITLRYVTLRYVTLHYITLHYIHTARSLRLPGIKYHLLTKGQNHGIYPTKRLSQHVLISYGA